MARIPKDACIGVASTTASKILENAGLSGQLGTVRDTKKRNTYHETLLRRLRIRNYTTAHIPLTLLRRIRTKCSNHAKSPYQQVVLFVLLMWCGVWLGLIVSVVVLLWCGVVFG